MGLFGRLFSRRPANYRQGYQVVDANWVQAGDDSGWRYTRSGRTTSGLFVNEWVNDSKREVQYFAVKNKTGAPVYRPLAANEYPGKFVSMDEITAQGRDLNGDGLIEISTIPGMIPDNDGDGVLDW